VKEETVAKLEVGIQFWPWYSINELVDYAVEAMKDHPFDYIWMCDEYQYEDCYIAMTAMAQKLDVSFGTMVTYPWRNPLDLAQRFTSLAKLVKPGRTVACGIGAGGSVQVQVIGEKKGAPLAVVQESVDILRGLFAGEQVELARFPRLAKRYRYNTETKARLYFPADPRVQVLLAAGGPKMCDMAGRDADGVILTQLCVPTSYLAAKNGQLKAAADRVEAARAGANGSRPYKRIYNVHVSVSKDGEAAWQWAKRNSSYALTGTYLRYPQFMEEVGLDPEEVTYVAQAYLQGLGVDEAARRVSDSLVRRAGLVFGGTPAEVIDQCLELKEYLVDLDYDHWVIGVPLGPNVPEALQLISREVIPAVVG
jgi:alkanesulfonate monooxygenase SsuD/methylene tetrahydromethanopterin reductase-like flavin-dependent oxidoreductase (luciferase family)